MLLSVLTTFCYAQTATVKRGDKQYDKYIYIDATKTYEHVAEKGYKSVDMFEKLANAYYFNSDLVNANKWYTELFAMNTEVAPEYYYRYSQSLRAVGQYDKADEMMALFNQKNAEDSRGKIYAENKDYLEVIKSNSGRYTIKDAGINSKYSDYGSAIINNELVFTTARDTGNFATKIHKWSNQYFTNLYSAKIITADSLGTPMKFAKDIKTKFHESTPVFTKNGRTMYFTRNNYNDGKRQRNENRITLLKIYKATYVNDSWDDAIEVSFNSNEYNTAHPTLSADEKTMYFASDMPGTLGQSDIFKVTINKDGSFGKPENLGKTINTEGKESFPSMTDKDELYFTSNGLPGLGGMDIFVATMDTLGSFTNPINIGAPVNSTQDDFAFLINTETRRGYFTSNREGGKGSDDIYQFIENQKLVCKQILSGIVTDIDTKEILPNTKLTFFDNQFKVIAQGMSDEKGFYTFEVECGKAYYIRAEKEDYETLEVKVSISEESGTTDLPIKLKKAKCKVTVGDNVGVCFGIKDIYFDFDKSEITPKAAIELEKILDVMNQYPKMKIDIRSFTDSRGSFKYNEKLSDRRAKSTVAWLIKNKVAMDRLTSKGYGESQLVNKCSDGVKCTEAEHQANRRSEFIITEM